MIYRSNYIVSKLFSIKIAIFHLWHVTQLTSIMTLSKLASIIRYVSTLKETIMLTLIGTGWRYLLGNTIFCLTLVSLQIREQTISCKSCSLRRTTDTVLKKYAYIRIRRYIFPNGKNAEGICIILVFQTFYIISYPPHHEREFVAVDFYVFWLM